jgi:asparagine synthase (glutamine-hydrolysing)
LRKIREVRLDFAGAPLPNAGMARGTAFVDEQKLAHDRLLRALPDGLQEAGLVLRGMNGFFKLAGRSGDHFVAAVDRVRSGSLFFTEQAGVLHLSSDPYFLAALWGNLSAESTRPEIAAEFLMSGFVTGGDTLHPQVHQLAAGEFLWAQKSKDGYAYDVQAYFEYRSTENIIEAQQLSLKNWMELLDNVATQAIERLIQVAGGRPIVVPLSGGRDSRLIALKLKQLAYPDVHCFSYGALGGFEARVSHAVAGRLGHPWSFISYDPNLWRNCRIDPSFSSYRMRAHSLSQIEHIQDWPALRELRGRIPADSLFVPGHTLDVLAGSHIPQAWEQDWRPGWQGIETALVDRHLSLWSRRALVEVFGSSSAPAQWKAMLERLRASLPQSEPTSVVEAVQAIEHFDWRERQAKFIVNSVRAYEDHGYDWWLPWWDAEVVSFWASVPLSLRFGRRLLNEYVDTFQATLGVESLPRPRRQIRDTSWALLRDAARFRSVLPIWHGLKRDGGWSALASHPMSWYSLVDREIAKWGYTGVEHVNAYLSRRYLDQ